MQIDVQTPFPPQINQSYVPFGFYKFGCCCWVYEGGYDGVVEWINTQHFVTEPKLPSPISFRYWFALGVTALVTPIIRVNNSVPDIELNGTFYNPVSGKNMPLLLE